MTATNLRPHASYFYWAFTLRLVDARAVESWATEAVAVAEHPPASLLELATLGACNTEAVLEQLRAIPGEEDSSVTFSMLMCLLARRYFTGIDPLSYTVRLCDALRYEFSSPRESIAHVTHICERWEGVEYGFGEAEQVFRSAFEDFLRQFYDENGG
jgi:hypothetical protein